MSLAVNCLLQTSCHGSNYTKLYKRNTRPSSITVWNSVQHCLLYIWHCDTVTMSMTTYPLSSSKCSRSQCSNRERRNQVINNINNLISSIADCFENDTYESTGCNKHNSMLKQIYQALFSASITVSMASVQHCLLLHMTLWYCDYVNDNLPAE